MTEEIIRVLQKDEPRYKKLKAIKAMLELYNGKSNTYEIKNIWFDYGARLEWTTIICHIKGDETISYNTYQILNPRQMEEIEHADTATALANIAEDLIKEAL